MSGEVSIIQQDLDMYTFEIGSEVVVGALTAGTTYLITGIDSSTVLPSGLEVGDFFTAPTALVLVSGSDDAVKPITKTRQCGMQETNGSYTLPEIDVTKNCDVAKNYRTGRLAVDLSTTLVLETSEGDETSTDVIIGSIIPTATDQGDGTTFVKSTVGAIHNVAIVLTSKNTTSGILEKTLFAPVRFSTGGFNGGMDDKLVADVKMSLAKGEFNPQILQQFRVS